MPYGMSKDMGGDSQKNDKWMETCVKKVKAQGKDESTAIAICKSTFRKMHSDPHKAAIAMNFYLDSLEKIMEEEDKEEEETE
jgi:hypothetical protein